MKKKLFRERYHGTAEELISETLKKTRKAAERLVYTKEFSKPKKASKKKEA